MQFTFTPTGAKGLDDFLARSAHHLSTLSATGRTGWFASWLPAVRGWTLQGELDAFTKSLVLMTMDRWADECEAEDGEHVTFEDDDDNDDADDRVYGSYEDQNRLRASDVL